LDSTRSTPLSPAESNLLNNRPNNEGMLRSPAERENPFDTLIPSPEAYAAGSELAKAFPLTLRDLLNESFQSTDRRRRIHAYWDLVEAMAVEQLLSEQYQHFSSLHSQVNQGITSGSSTAVRHLRVRTSRLSAKLQEAKLATRRAQFEVNAILANSSSITEGSLPVPVDAPHIGSYSTNSDSIANGRGLTSEAKMADQTRPMQLEAIRMHMQAVETASQSPEGPTGVNSLGLEDQCKAIATQTETKIDWVRSVINYNKTIGNYVTEVVGPGVTGTRLIATLIPLPESSPTPARSDSTKTPIDTRPLETSSHSITTQTPPYRETERRETINRTAESPLSPVVETRPLPSGPQELSSPANDVVPASAVEAIPPSQDRREVLPNDSSSNTPRIPSRNRPTPATAPPPTSIGSPSPSPSVGNR
jgi:hypothetical protein